MATASELGERSEDPQTLMRILLDRASDLSCLVRV